MPRHLVLVVCLLAAATRIAAFLATDRFRHPELWENEVVATNLLEGRGFTYVTLGKVYQSYMEPLYPALCASVYAVTGHRYWVMGLVNVALGTTLVWLVMVCAEQVAGPGPAIVAGLLAALHPGLIVYTTKFHPFVLDTALWFSAFAAVLAFAPSRPWRSVVVAGILIGLCVLTRPTILACLPAMLWWVWVRSTDGVRERFLRSAALVACVAAVAAPWVWRNYQTHHRFILTRSGTAFVFWLGNNPYAFTGSAMARDGREVIELAPPSVHAALAARDELGQQDYFQDEAMRYIRADPLAFTGRWARKLGYFWWFTPQAGMFYPAAWFRAYQLLYAVLLALSLAGVWNAWRAAAGSRARRQAILLVAGCCLAISMLQSLYYVEGRHRLAIEPFLLIFAGATISKMMPHARLA